MITYSDQSDMPAWPLWVWPLLIVIILIGAAIVAAIKDAAAAQVSPAPVQRRATNPECVRGGHVPIWFGEKVAWICGRVGCTESWPVPDRPLYDQGAC